VRRLLLDLSIGFGQLRRQPGRTFLTQLGMAIGVSTLVATLCLVEGSRAAWSVPPGGSPPFVLVAPWGAPGVPSIGGAIGGASAALPAPLAARVRSRTTLSGGRVQLEPVDRRDGAALAEAIELWLIDRGELVQVSWNDPHGENDAIVDHIHRLAVLMYASGALCLLAGAVGLFAILQTAADQRRLELAVRQVEGATRRDVLLQLACEAAFVCAAGIALGIPVGIACAHVVVRLLPGSAIAYPIDSIALGCGVLLALGLVFGSLPAWRVARQVPAAVLREA
jgi:hypothetical protein